VSPESRTQGPRELEWVIPTKNVPVCDTAEPMFLRSSYHLGNSLKVAEEAIDEVRETTLKGREKSQENSLHLQPSPKKIVNIRV